ncbi:hydroxymethylglutaryl-CoA lyase [Wenxinia marina]|uniref:Isopropylmalate/homocitrate/citramalate synthase n=1 Tax=Wenxinia marina DSM 24838 TaxID=1123501 RepID=A0A0D0PFK3_9RHOB|nr:hydroxymethylglutaryl-CoA lyase [Wenxinia marina]KIQ70121.1 Isopropylmalate/homocitrate/citramalate synthase [Wenxinia marina DSM 24838]GGL80854.1 hydroxymethylglutaryl-CoA lyase [Wenxinia marina]
MTARDVVICECLARDGLQHEPAHVPTATKVALIDSFSRAGFARIEATSYSHPGHVPAFADASEVLRGIARPPGVAYKATCPNQRAVDRALTDLLAGHGADELSLLVSATEAHTARNLRTTRADQWHRVEAMAAAARGQVRLVGVISMAWGCSFEGAVDPGRVAEDAARFADLGADLVTLGDTIGTATPRSVASLIARVRAAAPDVIPVGHFHDTRGTGLANCMAALEAGCTHLDSAMGGTGGHPAGIVYGEGFTGNVATEDLVNLLEEEGTATGLDLDAVEAASRACEAALGRPLRSMVARSGWGLSRRSREAADA